MRLVLALLCCSIATAGAGGYVGIGLGPSPTIRGELANRFRTGDDWESGRVRIGGRFDWIGFEHGATRIAVDRDGPASSVTLIDLSVLAYSPADRDLQLGVRFGFGSAIFHERSYTAGFHVTFGLVLQHVTRRGVMLWSDLSATAATASLEASHWSTGQFVQLTLGVGFELAAH